jgi:hypothetical protein
MPYMVDSKLTKTVGEHWVCATLARHDWAPALTRDGLERTDILAAATHLDHRPTIEVQVKSATAGSRLTSWPLGGIALEIARSSHEWVVLVSLPSLPIAPRGFVVPRDHASAATWVAHQHWLTDPLAAAGSRNAGISQARIQLPVWEGYEDRWDLLDKPATDALVLLPRWIRAHVTEGSCGIPSPRPHRVPYRRWRAPVSHPGPSTARRRSWNRDLLGLREAFHDQLDRLRARRCCPSRAIGFFYEASPRPAR